MSDTIRPLIAAHDIGLAATLITAFAENTVSSATRRNDHPVIKTCSTYSNIGGTSSSSTVRKVTTPRICVTSAIEASTSKSGSPKLDTTLASNKYI